MFVFTIANRAKIFSNNVPVIYVTYTLLAREGFRFWYNNLFPFYRKDKIVIEAVDSGMTMGGSYGKKILIWLLSKY